MRILIVHNRYWSTEPSGENAVVEEERALLRQAGHDVISLDVESDAIADWGLLRRAALPARVVWSRGGAAKVRDAIRTNGPDIVHFHNTFPLLSPAAIRSASAEGVATVQTFHNFRPFCPSSAGLLRDGRICRDCAGRLPLPGVLHGCYRGSRLATVPLAIMDALHQRIGTWTRELDRLIFPSEFAQSEYVGAGWPTERMVVKHNTGPRPIGDAPALRSGVYCVGRMRAEKGVDLLLEAWKTASSAVDEHLFLVGSGEDLPLYRAAAAGLPRVTFLGQRPAGDILELLAQARVLVVPSRVSEVFPRVVVEAYAHGTPVVAARRGSLADIVEDDETGVLFEPDSSADLARALTQACASPGRLGEMGAAARRRYERLYAPEATTARLLEIYEDAIAHRARRVAQ